MIVIKFAVENGCNTRPVGGANSMSSGSRAGLGWRALTPDPDSSSYRFYT